VARALSTAIASTLSSAKIPVSRAQPVQAAVAITPSLPKPAPPNASSGALPRTSPDAPTLQVSRESSQPDSIEVPAEAEVASSVQVTPTLPFSRKTPLPAETALAVQKNPSETRSSPIAWEVEEQPVAITTSAVRALENAITAKAEEPDAVTITPLRWTSHQASVTEGRQVALPCRALKEQISSPSKLPRETEIALPAAAPTLAFP